MAIKAAVRRRKRSGKPIRLRVRQSAQPQPTPGASVPGTGVPSWGAHMVQGGQGVYAHPPIPLHLGAPGQLAPRMAPVNLSEVDALLMGLYSVNMQQLKNGTPGISGALQRGQLRYQGDDPSEEWRTIREIWRKGGGDCEDLAAGLAAELTVLGVEARPTIYQSGPGVAHAVVRVMSTGVLLDPSRTGGM